MSGAMHDIITDWNSHIYQIYIVNLAGLNDKVFYCLSSIQ